MKNKKAAMEMSVGTIVTIVLLMSVLVLGIFLIQKIFSSGKNAVDLTDQQLRSEIERLFADDSRLVIYPTSGLITIKSEDIGAIGIGIKNLGSTANAPTTFSYEVIPIENNCGLTGTQTMQWISGGKEDPNIPIPLGSLETGKISFEIPLGTPVCLARFRVNVKAGSTDYDTEIFEVKVKG